MAYCNQPIGASAVDSGRVDLAAAAEALGGGAAAAPSAPAVAATTAATPSAAAAAAATAAGIDGRWHDDGAPDEIMTIEYNGTSLQGASIVVTNPKRFWSPADGWLQYSTNEVPSKA